MKESTYYATLIKRLLAGETIGPLEKMNLRDYADRLEPPPQRPACARCDGYGGCVCEPSAA